MCGKFKVTDGLPSWGVSGSLEPAKVGSQPKSDRQGPSLCLQTSSMLIKTKKKKKTLNLLESEVLESGGG